MVHDANQIALYFASYPQEQAVGDVAEHIKKYWERRMRQQLFTYVAQGGAGLHHLVLEAVKRLNGK